MRVGRVRTSDPVTLKAARDAFQMVDETCPAIHAANEVFLGIVKEQTAALRGALIEALIRAHKAEAEVSKLKRQLERGKRKK